MEWFFEKPVNRFARGTLFILLSLTAWGCLSEPDPDQGSWFLGADKLVHLSTYACLYVVAWFGFPGKPLRWNLHLSLLAYGLGMELLQSLTDYRSAEWADMMANATGLGLGCLMISLGCTYSRLLDRYRLTFRRGGNEYE